MQVPAGPLQEGTPPILTTQQLDGLHRHETGREPLLELERPGVCEHGGNIEPVGPARELREQRRVVVERGHPMTATGKIDRHPTGSGADLEYWIAMLGGQCPPKGQIGGIASALQVVPDRRHDALLASAALDRLTHRCQIIETKGESYRLRDAKSRVRKPGASGAHVDGAGGPGAALLGAAP